MRSFDSTYASLMRDRIVASASSPSKHGTVHNGLSVSRRSSSCRFRTVCGAPALPCIGERIRRRAVRTARRAQQAICRREAHRRPEADQGAAGGLVQGQLRERCRRGTARAARDAAQPRGAELRTAFASRAGIRNEEAPVGLLFFSRDEQILCPPAFVRVLVAVLCEPLFVFSHGGVRLLARAG